ncbi:hypothetical protein SISNIDRAFT_450615 [Sistotremastrum niveocremeum HHB9708]|uniref:Uncharacterized protein n=1 Tax=Sistotremastrum niveocremeum HHB9708 TaxID=1314777 RepID=A0A164YFP0_9AGAM|nr:hypothetical protein SISNIDRAFT_450615 [Sistotremastrum niveocremeum HHB9708]
MNIAPAALIVGLFMMGSRSFLPNHSAHALTQKSALESKAYTPEWQLNCGSTHSLNNFRRPFKYIQSHRGCSCGIVIVRHETIAQNVTPNTSSYAIGVRFEGSKNWPRQCCCPPKVHAASEIASYVENSQSPYGARIQRWQHSLSMALPGSAFRESVHEGTSALREFCKEHLPSFKNNRVTMPS